MLGFYLAARWKVQEPASGGPLRVFTPNAWLRIAADNQISAALGDLGTAALRHDFPAVTAAAGRVQAEGVTSRHAAEALGLQVCSQA